MRFFIVVNEDFYGGHHGIQDTAIIEFETCVEEKVLGEIATDIAIDMLYDLIESYSLDEYEEMSEDEYIEHAEWAFYSLKDTDKTTKELENELSHLGVDSFIEDYCGELLPY